jgi:spore coat protein U-like protein
VKRFFSCRSFAVLATLAVIFSWSPHQAADALSGDMAAIGIQVRVDVRCSIAVTPLNFGTYNIVTPTPTDADAMIIVDCNDGGVNNKNRLFLSQGLYPATGSSDNVPLRQMSNGGAGRVRYDIYQDAARTLVWGDVKGSSFKPGNAAVYPATFEIFGRIPAQQSGLTALPGSYTDSMVATLEF